MTIGPGAVTGHLCRGAARHDPGHGGMLRHTRSVAAVTGACMVMRRAVFETVDGLEPEHLAVTNNDLDFCLPLRARLACGLHAVRRVVSPRRRVARAGPERRTA
jgi:O-antigen biosynthesis protein